ncbi:helix-turn-helix domain-containing protein [Brachybacterium sp. Marseille-Q7125]
MIRPPFASRRHGGNAVLEGTPKAQVARDFGISRATLYRYLETPTLPM